MIEISAVMPAYNERGNVGRAVKRLDSFLCRKFKKYELIVVNDGSVDGTAQELVALKSKYKNLRVMSNRKNLGYGATVWRGLRAAKGELVFFTDSDLQFDVRELGKFLKKIKSCGAVIGYRVNRSEGIRRAFNAFGWRVVCRVLLGIKYKDIDCAFKLIRRPLIRGIRIGSTGAAFSAELLFKLSKSKSEVCELPVKHYKRSLGRPTGAKLSVILTGFKEIYGFYLTQKGLVRTRSVWIYSGMIVLLFMSRFVFASGSADFFDSNQYLWRTTSATIWEAMSQGHPPFHPLYLFFSTIFYKFAVPSVITAATLPSIVFGSLSIFLVFLIIKKLFSSRVAWVASISYALNPFVFISQITILVDPVMHCFFFLSLYLFLISLDDDGAVHYLKVIGSGVALGLSAFAHTQIAFWVPAFLSVYLIYNKEYSLRRLGRLLVTAVIMSLGVTIFVFLYLKLLMYSSSRGFMSMDIHSLEGALRYLVLGNVGDNGSIRLIVFLRKIMSIVSIPIIVMAVMGGVFMLTKKCYRVLAALLIWMVPGFITAFYIYENLHGRAMMVILVPIYILLAFALKNIRGRVRVVLVVLLALQILLVGFTAAYRYHFQKSANDALADAQRSLDPGGIFISSNTTKTWNTYDGEFVNFGDVGVGAGDVQEKVDRALSEEKEVFITQSAITLPYRRYDGVFWDIRSDIRRRAYENSTMLAELFAKYTIFPEHALGAPFYDFVYRVGLPEERYDLSSIGSILGDTKFVFGRLSGSSGPVSVATVNVMENQFCRVSRDNIGKYDFVRCALNIIRGRDEIESWSISDVSGYFYVKTNIEDPKVRVGLSYGSGKPEGEDKLFTADSIISVDTEKCTDVASLGEVRQRIEGLSGSYLVSNSSSGGYRLCEFETDLVGTNRLEAERMSGEAEVVRDGTASGGYILSNQRSVRDGFLCGGPYISLKPGRYKVLFRVASYNEVGSFNIDAVAESGSVVFATRNIAAQADTGKLSDYELTFSTDRVHDDFEFRVMSVDGAKIGLDYIELIKQ